ncbi:flavodoxin [Marmoricola sp. URHA0025 HA25]
MKALVVYESMFGNSERVARAIGEGISEYADVLVRDVATADPGEIPAGVDLLVAGGPTHAMAMSRKSTREDAVRQGADQGLVERGLREWLAALAEDLDGLRFTTFDTRVSRVRRLPGSAAHGAARVLRRRRGRILTAPESFFVGDVAGPLSDDQLERARSWGRDVGAVLTDQRHADAG